MEVVFTLAAGGEGIERPGQLVVGCEPFDEFGCEFLVGLVGEFGARLFVADRFSDVGQ